MFDLEVIDQMYEAGRSSGKELLIALCDKRHLLPLGRLPLAVARETGEVVTEEQLGELAELGWFPLLPGPADEGLGSPLYAPARIGLFLKLRRQGFTDAELQATAECEEVMIDGVFAHDELAYLDDDHETLILYTKARIEALSYDSESAQELERERENLRTLEHLRGIPPSDPGVVHHAAFRVRMMNECTRIMMLNQFRGQLEAGYSMSVTGAVTHHFHPESRVEITRITWSETIRSALAHHEDEEAPPIRVPGFLLRGELVTPTRTLPPAEYQRVWKEHDLDGYLHAWSALRGERRCLSCLAALPSDAHPKKRFCGERCKNIAKQRRHRQRNPEATDRARKRYWASVDLDDDDDGA